MISRRKGTKVPATERKGEKLLTCGKPTGIGVANLAGETQWVTQWSKNRVRRRRDAVRRMLGGIWYGQVTLIPGV